MSDDNQIPASEVKSAEFQTSDAPGEASKGDHLAPDERLLVLELCAKAKFEGREQQAVLKEYGVRWDELKRWRQQWKRGDLKHVKEDHPYLEKTRVHERMAHARAFITDESRRKGAQRRWARYHEETYGEPDEDFEEEQREREETKQAELAKIEEALLTELGKHGRTPAPAPSIVKHSGSPNGKARYEPVPTKADPTSRFAQRYRAPLPPPPGPALIATPTPILKDTIGPVILGLVEDREVFHATLVRCLAIVNHALG